MTNNFTNHNDFEPTPAMVLWIDTSIELLSDNISEIAKQCKVSRQSWYQWSKDQYFNKWFKREWQRRLATLGWKLDVIGLQRAKNNFSYWQAMQERIGNLPNKEPIEEPVIDIRIHDYLSEALKKSYGNDVKRS